MSYSVDVNVLLYASDRTNPNHGTARGFLDNLAAEPELLCVTWLTLMSYMRISTHPRIFESPLAPEEALGNVETLLSLSNVRVVTEQPRFLDAYRKVTGSFPVRGNLVPDAHLAAVLLQNEVRTLYTYDADFRKFDFLTVRTPS